MRLYIKNFGPIKDFEVDFGKKLTMIYGQNNIGKSYTMTIAYLLIKNFSLFRRDYQRLYLPFHEHYNDYQFQDKRIEKLGELKEVFDFSQDIYGMALTFLNKTLGNNLRESFKNSFGDLNKLNGAEIVLSIDISALKIKPKKLVQINKLDINLQIKEGNIVFEALDLGLKFYNNPNEDIYSNNIHLNKDNAFFGSKEYSGNIYHDIEFVVNYVISHVVNKGAENNIYQYFYIPGSRSGLYLGLKHLASIFLKISQNQALFSGNMPLSELSEPFSDFFITLTRIKEVTKNSNLLNLSKKIEQDVLNGEVIYDESKNTLMFKEKGKEVISLDSSSSMIAEISLLTAYFKYLVDNGTINYVNTNPIIFIEEPEAHLHPEKQVLMAEALAELVETSDIQVVVTSHSNYIFNKLNNLVMQKRLRFQNYNGYLLEKGEGGSRGKLLEIDEFGVDDENFSDVSEDLYEERMEIIDELNEQKESYNGN